MRQCDARGWRGEAAGGMFTSSELFCSERKRLCRGERSKGSGRMNAKKEGGSARASVERFGGVLSFASVLSGEG
eukprot:5916669-Pyramimonas_sp.AAC.1